MLTQDKIRSEFEKKLTEYDKDGGFRVFVEDYDNTDIDHDLVFAHLSAQYEKLIGEVILEMRERLSEIEHEQWTAWSKSIAENEIISPLRLERWQGMWCPYEELMEVHKDQDREWADKALLTIRTSLQERGIKIR